MQHCKWGSETGVEFICHIPKPKLWTSMASYVYLLLILLVSLKERLMYPLLGLGLWRYSAMLYTEQNNDFLSCHAAFIYQLDLCCSI